MYHVTIWTEFWKRKQDQTAYIKRRVLNSLNYTKGLKQLTLIWPVPVPPPKKREESLLPNPENVFLWWPRETAVINGYNVMIPSFINILHDVP